MESHGRFKLFSHTKSVSATIRDPKEPRRMDDEVVVMMVVVRPGSLLGGPLLIA